MSRHSPSVSAVGSRDIVRHHVASGSGQLHGGHDANEVSWLIWARPSPSWQTLRSDATSHSRISHVVVLPLSTRKKSMWLEGQLWKLDLGHVIQHASRTCGVGQ